MILALLCFVLGLALAAITPAAYKFWSYHRAVAHLPGPPLKGLLEWVLGFPLHAMKDKSTFHTEYARILAERGPIVAARIFHKRVFMVSDPEMVAAVLARPQIFDKRIVSYKMGTEALSRSNLPNLITAETTPMWRAVNRSIGPAFTQDNLLRMYPAVQDVWREVAAAALSKDTPQGVNIDRIMTEANFETILRLGFRYSMGTIGGGRDAKGQLFLDDMAGAFKVAFEILSSKKANDKKLFKKKAAAEEPAHQTFVALWELSEALLVHSRAVGLAPGDPEVGAHLLQARDPATGQPLSDEKLAAEITILLIAGHETSSHTTSMALALLAMNPQALARVEEELRGLGLLATPANPSPRVPTWEDLPKLKYTWQAAKEASRLFPAVFFLPRRALQDATVCGIPVAAGTMFVLCVGALNRSALHWDDPLKFDPGRFDDLEEAEFVVEAQHAPQAPAPRGLMRSASMARKQERGERTSYARRWSSFSQGPRSCAGQNLAKINLLLGISTIVGRFNMRAPPGLRTLQDLDKLSIIRFTMQVHEWDLKLTPRV